jgi:hypothetical protein
MTSIAATSRSVHVKLWLRAKHSQGRSVMPDTSIVAETGLLHPIIVRGTPAVVVADADLAVTGDVP